MRTALSLRRDWSVKGGMTVKLSPIIPPSLPDHSFLQWINIAVLRSYHRSISQPDISSVALVLTLAFVDSSLHRPIGGLAQ
jgi:hypothetical protein